jgi:seryl-tRNA synthetase
MLDIRFIRENADLVAKKSEQKGYNINIKALIELDEKRLDLLQKREEINKKSNELAKTQNVGAIAPEEKEKFAQNFKLRAEEGRKLKEQRSEIDKQLVPIENQWNQLLWAVPNVFPDDTPIGGEEANREEKKWGKAELKDFKVQDHLAWGEARGLIDFERGAKVAGNKFYYLKGSLVELELAVIQLAMKLAIEQKFCPILPPNLVNSRMIDGTGFSARGDENQIYKIEDEDLNLIATAEIPLTGYHADEILKEAELPLLYVGLSPAYRREGGAYGKHNKGLFRTHQFNKMELYVFCKPEESEQWHQKLIELEEKLCQALEIPYQIVRIASGDLGAPAYKKYDIEYWTPVDKTYRELMSCSNVTDYQARRLNIRYKNKNSKTVYAHTLNGTLAAMSRIPIALIENHQLQDGNVQLPKALQPYMGGKTEI